MRHQSYTAEKQLPVIDWHKVIQMPDMDINEARYYADQASNWVTCACGTQCSIIPRKEDGQPLDEKLRVQGSSFYHAIYNNFVGIQRLSKELVFENPNTPGDMRFPCSTVCMSQAKEALDNIERRSAYVIESLLEEQIERNGSVEL